MSPAGVGNGHRGREERLLGGLDRGTGENDPREQAEGDGERGAVEQSRDVAAGATAADEQHQADGEDGIGSQVERIGRAGEQLVVRDVDLPRADRIAYDPDELAGGHEVPGRPAVRSVQSETDHEGDHAGDADDQVADVLGDAEWGELADRRRH